MTDKYDRIKNLLEVYRRALPGVEDKEVFEHLTARGDRLGLGRDNPILEAMAGFLAGGAAGFTRIGAHGGATAIGMGASKAVKEMVKKLDIDRRVKELKDIFPDPGQ